MAGLRSGCAYTNSQSFDPAEPVLPENGSELANHPASGRQIEPRCHRISLCGMRELADACAHGSLCAPRVARARETLCARRGESALGGQNAAGGEGAFWSERNSLRSLQSPLSGACAFEQQRATRILWSTCQGGRRARSLSGWAGASGVLDDYKLACFVGLELHAYLRKWSGGV